MKLLVIHNAEPEDIEYNQPLITAVKKFCEVDVVQYQDAPRAHAKEYSGIILSGVPKQYSYATIEERLPYLAWVKEVSVPILGICLGHENIGRLYGSSVLEEIEAEEGYVELHIFRDDPLFAYVTDNARFFASHRASISLPDGFIQLASSSLCKNQIMKHKSKYIYGMQFHPELSDGGIQLLRGFMMLCDKLEDALSDSAKL